MTTAPRGASDRKTDRVVRPLAAHGHLGLSAVRFFFPNFWGVSRHSSRKEQDQQEIKGIRGQNIVAPLLLLFCCTLPL